MTFFGQEIQSLLATIIKTGIYIFLHIYITLRSFILKSNLFKQSFYKFFRIFFIKNFGNFNLDNIKSFIIILKSVNGESKIKKLIS